MRLCRYEFEGQARYGAIIDGDQHLQPLAGHPLTGLQADGDTLEIARTKLLVPILPSKVVAIGRNYRAHAAEMGKPVPEKPLLFLKATSALLAPGFTIRLPAESQRVDHEAELAVVIGKTCRKVSKADAKSFVFGFTCLNDVTARDIQQAEVQFTRGKGFDTFCPLGPWINTEFDPTDKEVVCRVNGEVKQRGRTSDMVFDVWDLVSYVSHSMTLLPGDVIATGTPAGVGPLSPGQVCEVEIEGLGTLSNPVEAEGA